MKNPDVPKITVLMLNMTIYKGALNSRTLEGEPLTTPGWENQARVSVEKFLRVFARLPRGVRRSIQRVWDKEPAKNPITGQHYPAPVVIFAYEFAEMTAQLGRQAWAKNEENVFWFDADVLLNAPSEVSDFLIAHQLAFTYQLAIHGSRAFERNGFELEANRFLEEWGYPLLDDRLWEKAKGTANPHLRFYADHFARFGFPPPPTADVEAMKQIYLDEGMPELVDMLRNIVSQQSTLKFSLN